MKDEEWFTLLNNQFEDEENYDGGIILFFLLTIIPIGILVIYELFK
jgi:hypothetical protein